MNNKNGIIIINEKLKTYIATFFEHCLVSFGTATLLPNIMGTTINHHFMFECNECSACQVGNSCLPFYVWHY
jgi:hypothetical protein